MTAKPQVQVKGGGYVWVSGKKGGKGAGGRNVTRCEECGYQI